VKRRRTCRKGHVLIAGETAYVVARWGGRELCLRETGGTIIACDADTLHGTPCKYGALEAHRRLEGAADVGGTRVVGTTTDGRTLWQHREFELRCRECNRDRVARHRRAKREREHAEWIESVIGGSTAPNYGHKGP
jgi:hypothetical protein